MTFPANNLTRIHCTGDSITSLTTGALGNWPGEPGGFTDQLRAQHVAFTAVPALGTFVPAKLGLTAPAYSDAAPRGRSQVVTTYGVGGRLLAGLQADLQASVYIWDPDILIIEIGTNDFGVTAVGPGSAFAISYAATLDAIHAQLPNCKILPCSVPCRTEQVTAGHFNGGVDTWAGNTDIQTAVAARSTYCEYVDIIGPALAYEIANNAGNITPFALTQDSLHPSSRGKLLIANEVLKHLTFT